MLQKRRCENADDGMLLGFPGALIATFTVAMRPCVGGAFVDAWRVVAGERVGRVWK
jgi:hypothetical protein